VLRKTIVAVVILAGLYLLTGYLFARFELIPGYTSTAYFASAAIVGGIASVFGLLGIALPSLTIEDVRRVELDGLRRVADLADEMQAADEKLAATSAELDSLEKKREKMEFLVQKASLSLHLQSRLEQVTRDLVELYHQKTELEARLHALGEEVKASADQELIEEVTEIVRKKESAAEQLAELFWMKPSFFGIGIDLNALVKRLTKQIKK